MLAASRVLNEIRFEQTELAKERSGVEKEQNKIDTDSASAQDKIAHIDSRIRALAGEKASFAAIRKNQIARFGKDVPRILELINANKGRFEKLPIGPIGNFCSLKRNFSILNIIKKFFKYLFKGGF